MMNPLSHCFRPVAALVLIVAFQSGVVSAEAPARPNIVYILADDMGVGDVSALNPESAWKTPNIDRLAREGMAFTDAHSSSAVCTPSRYSILTGRYAWRSRLKSGVGGGVSAALIEPDRLTVASFLRKEGYSTTAIGKWHLGLDWAPAKDADPKTPPVRRVDYSKPFSGGPLDCGFDHFFGVSASLDMPPYTWLRDDHAELPPSDEIAAGKSPAYWRGGPVAKGFAHVDVLGRLTEEAEKTIAAQTNGRPFFLYLALTAPHTPIVPSPEFKGRTKTTDYGDFCYQVDDVVGRVLAALSRRHLETNTLVVFTADNGCSPEANFAKLRKVHHDPQAGRRGYKADIYEGGHRVPFIVRWPGKVAPGRLSAEPICQSDLLATCAEVLGLSLPANTAEDSVSLLPELLGRAHPAPLREAIVHHSIHGDFAVRQGDWKLCLCPGSGGWSAPRPGAEPADAPPFQLFNLAVDPAEKNNVASSHAEIVQRLGRLMKRYVDTGRSTAGERQANASVKRWPEVDWMERFKE
jgi:arylsulfatase A